jgi:hypothetical protein
MRVRSTRKPRSRTRSNKDQPASQAPLKETAMQKYQPQSAPTPEEKLFRQMVKQSEGEKARAEYQARQAAILANMQRLRSLRQAQTSKAAL